MYVCMYVVCNNIVCMWCVTILYVCMYVCMWCVTILYVCMYVMCNNIATDIVLFVHLIKIRTLCIYSTYVCTTYIMVM